MDNRSIGVFDSGVGGLTVLKELLKVLPNEHFIYLGDTARVPYGSKSRETVIKYSRQAADFFVSKNVKAIVIACNTASAHALNILQSEYKIPVIIGVVEPGSLAVAQIEGIEKVAIIATKSTVNSKAYEHAIERFKKGLEIKSKACPLFVPIVEEGWENTDISKNVASAYLEELSDWKMDALVLGCTHYPILMDTIKSVVDENVILINPAEKTAKAVYDLLFKLDLLSDGSNKCIEYNVTDDSSGFIEIAEKILEFPVEKVKKVVI